MDEELDQSIPIAESQGAAPAGFPKGSGLFPTPPLIFLSLLLWRSIHKESVLNKYIYLYIQILSSYYYKSSSYNYNFSLWKVPVYWFPLQRIRGPRIFDGKSQIWNLSPSKWLSLIVYHIVRRWIVVLVSISLADTTDAPIRIVYRGKSQSLIKKSEAIKGDQQNARSNRLKCLAHC